MIVNYLNESIFKNVRDIKNDKTTVDSVKEYLNFCKDKINAALSYIRDNCDRYGTFKYNQNCFAPDALCLYHVGTIKDVSDIKISDNNTIEVVLNVKGNTDVVDFRDPLRLNSHLYSNISNNIKLLEWVFSPEGLESFGLKRSIYKFNFKLDVSDTRLFYGAVAISTDKFFNLFESSVLVQDFVNLIKNYFINYETTTKRLYIFCVCKAQLIGSEILGQLFKAESVLIQYKSEHPAETYDNSDASKNIVKCIDNVLIPSGGNVYIQATALGKLIDDDSLEYLKANYKVIYLYD